MNTKALIFVCAIVAGSRICVAGNSEQTGKVTVYAIKGSAEYSSGGSDSKPLKPGQELPPGTTVKTGPGSSVDLVLPSSGSAVHLNPGSELDVNKLTSAPAGDQVVSETALSLKSGSMVGNTAKMPALSQFNVNTCDGGTLHFNGTQYLVSANGAVTVLSGTVTVDFDLKGKKNDDKHGVDDKVTVSAGQSFDPKTGKVVPTSPDFLKNIIADVKTVKDISETFKTGGAVIVVDVEDEASPIHGHHHDHDHDGDHDHDHDKDDHGHDHDGHDHHDDHGGSDNHYAGGDSGHGK